MFITNAKIHVGNGTVINNGTIKITDGKIVQVGTNISTPAGEKVIDAKGKQVYPGIILPESDLGFKEIANAVRGSTIIQKLGDMESECTISCRIQYRFKNHQYIKGKRNSC